MAGPASTTWAVISVSVPRATPDPTASTSGLPATTSHVTTGGLAVTPTQGLEGTSALVLWGPLGDNASWTLGMSATTTLA